MRNKIKYGISHTFLPFYLKNSAFLIRLSIISHKKNNTSETKKPLNNNIFQGKHEVMHRLITYYQAVLYNT